MDVPASVLGVLEDITPWSNNVSGMEISLSLLLVDTVSGSLSSLDVSSLLSLPLLAPLPFSPFSSPDWMGERCEECSILYCWVTGDNKFQVLGDMCVGRPGEQGFSFLVYLVFSFPFPAR